MGRLRRRAPVAGSRAPSLAPAPTPAPASPAASAHVPAPGSTPGPAARPHRQILSNGSLLKAAAAASACSPPSAAPESDASLVSASPSPSPSPPGAGAARVRGVGPVAARVHRQQQQQQQLLLIQQRSAVAAHIRVGSSVSSLITGAAGGSIVSELQRHAHPPRAPAPADTNGHPDALHSHFEEFRLEDVEIGSAGEAERSSGDGASPAGARAPCRPPKEQPRAGATSYDVFLEATGLSQKPLLTPSRLLSNHRSVLKPKDVKLRSRAARAPVAHLVATPSGALPPDRPPPVVRYWVEPFL